MGKKSKRKGRSTTGSSAGAGGGAAASPAAPPTSTTITIDTECAVCEKPLNPCDWTEREHAFMACCGHSICKPCQLGSAKAADKAVRKHEKKVISSIKSGTRASEIMDDEFPVLLDIFARKNLCDVCSMCLPRNEAEHRERIDRLAQAGHPQAQFTKGCSLAKAGRYDQALIWYEKSAEGGHKNACAALGEYFYLGKGGMRVRARQWYEQAPNHAMSLYGLGRMYREGVGVPCDAKKSTELFRKSAEQDYPPGVLEYGTDLFHMGEKQEAMVWFEKCARGEQHLSGYQAPIAHAQYNLARMILVVANDGEAHLPDRDPAPLTLFWARRAEQNGLLQATEFIKTVKGIFLGRCSHCLLEQEDLGKKLMICSVCKAAAYCSRDCQVQHYKRGHKVVCKGLPQIDIIPENACAHCHQPMPPKVCQGCLKAHYCDEKCQKLHYSAHKKQCRELRARDEEGVI